jgi:hypothetical protein
MNHCSLTRWQMQHDAQCSDVLVEISNNGVVDFAVRCVRLDVLDPPGPSTSQSSGSERLGCRMQHGRRRHGVGAKITIAPLDAVVMEHHTRCGSQWCLMTAPAPSRHALQTPAAAYPPRPAPLCTPAKRSSTMCAHLQQMLIHRPPGHHAVARIAHATGQIVA